MANTVIHFAHKEHPLSLTNLSSSYTCDGCENKGSGPRYRCNSCNFDLHEFCAKCPERISFFGHPHHQLVLVSEKVWKKLPAYSNGAKCDLCFEPVGGMMYRCVTCYVDIHPLCSLLPSTVKHAPAHPKHELALVPHLPGVCTVCSRETKIWHYRCAPCGIDLHPQCVGETQANAEGQSSGAGVRGERPVAQHVGQRGTNTTPAQLVAQHGGRRGTNTSAKVAKFVLKFGLSVATSILGIPSPAEVLADALVNVFDQ